MSETPQIVTLNEAIQAVQGNIGEWGDGGKFTEPERLRVVFDRAMSRIIREIKGSARRATPAEGDSAIASAALHWMRQRSSMGSRSAMEGWTTEQWNQERDRIENDLREALEPWLWPQ